MNLGIFPPMGLLLFSLIVLLALGLLRNYYGNSVISTDSSEYYLFSAATAGLTALLTAGMSGFQLRCSAYTVLTAAGFGFVTMLLNVSVIKAMAIGPFSYTTVINSSGCMLSALSGFFFFDEKLSALKIAGMALMLICFVLSVKRDENEKRGGLLWLVIALISAAARGAIGLIQKLHQSSSHAGELMPFLIIAFLFACVFSYCFFVHAKMKEKAAGQLPEHKKPALFVFMLFFVSALCISLVNIIHLYLAGVMEAAVLFPIINGGGLILAVVFGMLVLRDNLKLFQLVGIICGIAATLLLCL